MTATSLNFALLDANRPEVARLIAAMVQARDAVEHRSWSHPQESTGEEWWADVLADPRARKRGRRTDLAVKRAYYRLADEKREIILVACSKCDWRAAFERDELIAAHGADYAMPNLLNHLAAPDCNRVDSQWDRCDQERCSTASRACTIAAIRLATSGRLASSKAKFSEVAVICPNPPRLRASRPAYRRLSS
jgi:hypothetical protein